MDVTPYCSSAGFDAASPVLSEIHSTLASLDVNVEQVLDIEFFFFIWIATVTSVHCCYL